MPRRRADKVIEHRLSLSDGLHKEMKKTIADNRIQSQIAMAGNGAKAIMNVGAVAGIGFVAYLGVKIYGKINDAVPSIKETMDNVWDWGFGLNTDADGNIVPSTVTITNVHGEEETVVNPIYKVPVIKNIWGVGGLFDWGMKIGAANNPFEDNAEAAALVDELTGFTWEEQKQYQDYLDPDFDMEAWKAAKAEEIGVAGDQRSEHKFEVPVKVFEEAEGGGLGLDMGLGHLEENREMFEAMADANPLNPDHPTTSDYWAYWSQTMRSAGIDMYGTLDLSWSYAQYVTWWNENLGA